MRKSIAVFVLGTLIASTLTAPLFARTSRLIKESFVKGTSSPAYCLAGHKIGKIHVGVSNNGTLGNNYSASGGNDCFTGARVPNVEYPKGSGIEYLFGAAFWIGAVVGRDTLVSVGQDGWTQGAEFHPDEPPLGNMIFRSIIDPTKVEFEGAISEEDYIAVYFDTCLACPGITNDFIDGRPHQPLNIQVTQRSFAWSYSYAEDFVLFDYSIKNIGTQRLRRVFMGIYVDADVHDAGNTGNGAQDDLTGFKLDLPATYMPPNCPAIDTVFIAYISDADGDFTNSPWRPAPQVTGMRIVRTPSDSLVVSYNWWIGNGSPALDFGPMSKKKFRNLSTGGVGTPEGDRNKYAFLSNGEFDYDQIRTASIDNFDTLWTLPNQVIAKIIARGIDTRYLLSFGPFEIDPGQVLPLSFAYIAGEDFHTDPDNWEDHLNQDPIDWEGYKENLDFSDLGLNATWSSWIYDNPGVDSDSDGFAGLFRICASDSFPVIDTLGDTTYILDRPDTIWYQGDGVPDFTGATPPPSPASWAAINGKRAMRVEPSVVLNANGSRGRIKVRWNGHRSELTRDIFSRELDFEGYRVWLARDDRSVSYNLLASYDIEDFSKLVFSDISGKFELIDNPFSLDQLRTLYAPGGVNDSIWHPLQFPQSNTFQMPGFPDSVFFFKSQDFNQSELGVTTPILKTFPNAPEPPASWSTDSVSLDSIDIYLTEPDGFFKFFEYEFTIDSLLPTVPYWVNVTAFDFGSPASGLPSLETSRTLLPSNTFATESVDSVAVKDLEVYTFPNPYRIDANYRDRGFEGRGDIDREQADDRARQIHFANLPPKCIISIFSLDGDLVQQIDHDVDPLDPLANHDVWDLITRNTQLAVSGIYYWTVEVPNGRTQIGKIVIIL